MFAANAAGTQIFDVLITDTEVATSNAYVGGFIGNAERITAQKVFADAELDIPYTVSPQNTAAFIGQASEDSKIQYSTAAGGVYPEDPSSTRYKPVSYTHLDVYKRQAVLGMGAYYVSTGAMEVGSLVANSQYISCLLYTSRCV